MSKRNRMRHGTANITWYLRVSTGPRDFKGTCVANWENSYVGWLRKRAASLKRAI